MTEVVQLYPPEAKDVAPEAADRQAKYNKLAHRLGFSDLVAASASTRAETLKWCEANGLSPLTDEELSLWRRYLPSSYWSNTGKALRNASDERILGFSSYRFHEGVPMSVLERMEKLTGLFDVLEIRTPETPLRHEVSDPALWGHVIASDGSRKIYPLARWAESDANFISGVEDLKKIFRARAGFLGAEFTHPYEIVVNVFGLAFIGAIVFGLAALGVSYLWSGMPYGGPAILSGIIAGAGLAVCDGISHSNRRRKLKKTDPQLFRLL